MNDGRVTRIPDVSNHKASAIDLSLISPSLVINCNWDVEDDCLGSDHFPVSLSFDDTFIPDSTQKEDIIPKFLYKLADWDSFQAFLEPVDTARVEDDDINIFYSNFSNLLISASEQAIPKCKQMQNGKRRGNAWWTEECEIAVSHKKEQFKVWMKYKTDTDFISYKSAKMQCKKIIAKAKKHFWTEYYKREVSESKDLTKVWKKVREMKNGSCLPSFPIQLENNKFPTMYEKAEAFVNMFSENSLSSKIQNDIEKGRSKEKQIDLGELSLDNLHYMNGPIHFSEFIEALETFTNNSSAVGIDGVSYKMLIHLPLTWKKLLFSFFQKCWKNGTLPSLWKQSVVVPILKEGKPRWSLNSYRPIALTSHVGKVLEKIIQTRLLHYCEKNNIIPTNQAGFRKGRSTTDHLVKLTHQIKKQFSRRKSVLATFFDVKKAYDKVCHERLLYKLRSININGLMLQYIRNFLSERSICTKVGGVYSSAKTVDLGVPQGSVLAPLLFSILIYDLPKCLSNNVHAVQYADDIAIWLNTSLRKHTKLRVISYVQTIYQNELNNLSRYMKENRLEFSVEKTCLVLFNNGENPKTLPVLKLDETTLQYKHIVKFLGVHLTKKLNWKLHIEKLILSARKRLNFLKIVSSQAWSQDTRTLIHLAVSLIRSKLTYGQEVYFSASNTLLKRLQSIDSKAIKLALGVPVHSNTHKTYKEAGLLSLFENRKLAVSRYVIRSLSVPNSVREEIFFYQKRIIQNVRGISHFYSPFLIIQKIL